MKDHSYHSAPEWLTADYMESVLRKHKKDNTLEIVGLDIKPATNKGENYASVMTRIKVDFHLNNSKEVHHAFYIVKTTFEADPYVADIMNSYDVARTEMLMYEKVLPQLSQLLHEIGDEDKLFADTLHVDYKYSAIIFEDLSVSNFVNADRVVGMDEVHAKLALKKLAKMHATAAVLNERQPNFLTKFDRGIFNRHSVKLSPIFKNLIEECAYYAEEEEDLGVYYKDKLLKLRDNLTEYATRVFDHKAGHFHTLTHGDYWINNVMLRYFTDDQKVNKTIKDLLIIDLQFCAWASPAVDLHYFLNNSLESHLSLQHQGELIQYYYKILVDTLRKLNFAGHIPTLHDFVIQMEAGRFYAVTSSLVTQPVMINSNNDDADFRALMLDDERGRKFRKMLYRNKALQSRVKVLLPLFDQKGLLDPMD